MDKEELINYIKEPEKLQFKSLYDLMDVRDQYPYFQAVYPLILKLLKTNRRFQYKVYLEKAAVQLTGRELLFEFINIDENAYQKTAYQVQADMHDDAVDLTVDELQLSESESNDLINPEEIYQKADKLKDEKVTKEEKEAEKKEFNKWLKTTLKTKIRREDGEKSAMKPQKDDVAQQTPKQSKLIDQFIQKNPSITSPKQFESKKDSSLRDHPGSQMMTETLAKILIEQKKYDRAIQAYKTLILSNPEKNSFFVDQIERIKKLQEKSSS